MKLNQTTLRIISEGNCMPDHEYVVEMAKALLKEVFIVPRLDGDKRPDGSPQWYDCYKEGVKRAEVYRASTVSVFTLEIDGNDKDWVTCKSIEECEAVLKRVLK